MLNQLNSHGEDQNDHRPSRIARRKLSLLQLAQALGNISKACPILRYNRQHFYEIRPGYPLRIFL